MHLCALITPGLIIDAFGELRDQQEQVKEDMEVGHVKGQTLGTWRRQGEGFPVGLHSDVSHDRPSASSVASVVTTSILHRMGLRPTHWRNTTWPITCKYDPVSHQEMRAWLPARTGVFPIGQLAKRVWWHPAAGPTQPIR